MSKLFFGENSVVPVRDLRQDLSAGTGIDADLLEQNSVAVDSTVLRNLAANTNSSLVLNTPGNNVAKTKARNVDLSVHGGANGDDSIAIGYNAVTGTNVSSIAIGAYSLSNGSNVIAIGYKAGNHPTGSGNYSNSIVIGNNSYFNQGEQVLIGTGVQGGNAAGTIVIGHNSKPYTSNNTYPMVIIGNDINGDKYDSTGSVIIGGVVRTTEDINNRPIPGSMGVAIGLNAGATDGGGCIVAVGASSRTTKPNTVAVGFGAEANGNGNISIGVGANSNSLSYQESDSSIAIGKDTVTSKSSICIGWNARAQGGSGNILIGNRTTVNNKYNTIAIGVGAQVDADYSIQLGFGTNSEENTFNVGFPTGSNYKMLEGSTGLIPKERISYYTPQNGQVLYYDSTAQALKWKDVSNGGSGGGSYTLPVASRSTLGGVKIGSGLNVTTDGVISTANQTASWGNISGRLLNQTDLQNALDAKQNVIQYQYMPTPKASLAGQVAQYIGGESELYTTGNFYKCEEGDTATANITSDTQWGNLEVDAWAFANYIAKYFYSGDLNAVPSKLYTIEYVNQFDGYGWILYENETSVYVKDIYKMGIIAEGAEPAEGDCIYVQLIMRDSTDWIWRKLLIDAQVTVNNTLVSTSTKQALSANMGRVLNDKITELSGISHFLAMWDADTGTARYLETGYQYASGDYFIIATVGETSPTEHGSYTGTLGPGTSGNRSITVDTLTEEALESWENAFTKKAQRVKFSMDAQYNFSNDYNSNVYSQTDLKQLFGINLTNFLSVGDSFFITYSSPINYMPDGSSYTGDSHSRTETTDPVQISDMYFYDGAHWVFLPSSSRQIAVDEQLDASSRNPVENRVVTNALSEKLQKYGDENALYVNDVDGNPTMVTLGSGLSFDWDNYELKNTKTSGVWGQITGNIESQTDLVNYVASHGGSGSSSGKLLDVFTKDREIKPVYGTLDHRKMEYKGDYSDLYFRVTGSYESLYSAKNDIYVTISRLADSNKARNKKQMRIMNDCNRFKTDKKYYCWRYISDQRTYDYSEDEWVYGEPRQTEFRYFYVPDNYATASELIGADPTYHVSPMSNSAQYPYKTDGWRAELGNWASCFNELANSGMCITDLDSDPTSFERVPEYDIDSVVSLNSNFSGSKRSSEYGFGNVVKNQFTKMHCRVYNTTDGKVYLWSSSWDPGDDEDIYAYIQDNDVVPNEIPEFMGDLSTLNVSVATFLSDETNVFIEKRPDLNWYRFANLEDFVDVIDYLRLSTQDFPDQEDAVGGYNTNWNSYWLDYPIKPVRLANCKLYIYKVPTAYGDSDLHNEFADRAGGAFTWEEIENDPILQEMVANQDDLIFVLPYDTSYIWLRLLGWQKQTFYRFGNENNGYYAEPYERHNLLAAAQKMHQRYIGHVGRIFGAKSFDFGDDSNIYYYRLQFNTISGKDLGQNKVSMNTPISRKIWINGYGRQRLAEQI